MTPTPPSSPREEWQRIKQERARQQRSHASGSRETTPTIEWETPAQEAARERAERVHPDPTKAHLPTGSAKQCRDILIVDIDHVRHVFECEIQEIPLRDPTTGIVLEEAHPNQPHMVSLAPTEPGDQIFIGWYHEDVQLHD